MLKIVLEFTQGLTFGEKNRRLLVSVARRGNLTLKNLKELQQPCKKCFSSSSEDSESDSEHENESEEDENTVTPSNAKKKKPNNELVTVNMDDLGDLLSKPNMYYAKKSSPKGQC